MCIQPILFVFVNLSTKDSEFHSSRRLQFQRTTWSRIHGEVHYILWNDILKKVIWSIRRWDRELNTLALQLLELSCSCIYWTAKIHAEWWNLKGSKTLFWMFSVTPLWRWVPLLILLWELVFFFLVIISFFKGMAFLTVISFFHHSLLQRDSFFNNLFHRKHAFSFDLFFQLQTKNMILQEEIKGTESVTDIIEILHFYSFQTFE